MKLKSSAFLILSSFVLINLGALNASANDDLEIEGNESIQENVVNSFENEENTIDEYMLISDPEKNFDFAWAAGTKIVRDRGHSWTAELMTKANSNNASDITYSFGSTPSTLISGSSEFKSVLSKIDKSKLSKTKSQRATSNSVFNSGQLKTALQHYNYDLMLYWDASTSTWKYTGTINDLYDFRYEVSLAAYGNDFGVALGNNTAALGLKMGWLNQYYITVNVSGTF